MIEFANASAVDLGPMQANKPNYHKDFKRQIPVSSSAKAVVVHRRVRIVKLGGGLRP